MNCPVCKQEMKKLPSSITNNQKAAAEYKEYTSTMYHCEKDDAWVNVELPVSDQSPAVQ